MSTVKPIDVRANSQRVPPGVARATQKNTRTALHKRAQAVETLGDAHWESLRTAAHAYRLQAITHLDEYLTRLEDNVTQAGGRVHWAADAAAARRIVLDIAAQHQAKRVVKVKSLVSEEIELNAALQAAGIRASETDLGEYIVQLAGERPSHITAPALHMTKEQIAQLFHDKLGVDAPPDPAALTEIARTRLRHEFLSADMGISGGNFLIANTGTLVLVTNEGNGRMCTSLPPVHVAIVGIEKVIPDWQAAAVLIKLLARSATGQKITSYTTFITGAGESGPHEFHLVLLDNGRSRILADAKARETLLCIRCGVCCNVCPVYNTVGGHAYGWVYPGPIGAILTPQLLGNKLAADLPFASSLCGACADYCPVKIPIPDILLHLRKRVVQSDRIQERPVMPAIAQRGARLGAWAIGTAWIYRAGIAVPGDLTGAHSPGQLDSVASAAGEPLDQGTAFSRVSGRFSTMVASQEGTIMSTDRDLILKQVRAALRPVAPGVQAGRVQTSVPLRRAGEPETEIELMMGEIRNLGGRTRRIKSRSELAQALADLVKDENVRTATMWDSADLAAWDVARCLTESGVDLVPATAAHQDLAACDLGITGADGALPETGTLVLRTSAQQPQLVSLLPRIHLALVRPAVLLGDLDQALDLIRADRHAVLISGPSRTADIEKVLALGVHGPRALYVWSCEL